MPAEYRRRGYRHTASWAFYGTFYAITLVQGPFVIRQLGGSALQSLLVNYGLAVPLIFAVLWVPFIERRNPVRLTGLLLGLGGVLVVFSGLANSTWSLALILAAGMALSNVSRPTLGTALSQMYPERWRGQLLSLPNTMAMLARMACLAVTGRLLAGSIDLYRWVFPVAGMAMVVGGLLFRGVGGSRGARTAVGADAPVSICAQVATSLRATFRNKFLLAFLIGYFITTCGSVAYSNALPIFARDDLRLTTAQWGYASAAFTLAMLLSFYFWGLFLDRFGAALTVVLSWLLQCGIFGLMAFVQSWPPFFALVAVRGLFQAGNFLAFFPMVMHFTESSEMTRGMGLHFSLWGIRWALVATAVVWIIDGQLFSIRYIFLGGVLLVALGTGFMALVWNQHRLVQKSDAG